MLSTCCFLEGDIPHCWRGSKTGYIGYITQRKGICSSCIVPVLRKFGLVLFIAKQDWLPATFGFGDSLVWDLWSRSRYTRVARVASRCIRTCEAWNSSVRWDIGELRLHNTSCAKTSFRLWQWCHSTEVSIISAFRCTPWSWRTVVQGGLQKHYKQNVGRGLHGFGIDQIATHLFECLSERSYTIPGAEYSKLPPWIWRASFPCQFPTPTWLDEPGALIDLYLWATAASLHLGTVGDCRGELVAYSLWRGRPTADQGRWRSIANVCTCKWRAIWFLKDKNAQIFGLFELGSNWPSQLNLEQCNIKYWKY